MRRLQSRMSRILVVMGLALTLAVSVMPARVQAEEIKMGVVDTGSLNVRSAPSTDGEAIGKLPEGTQITILGEEDGWYEIDYNGQTGYVSASYVNLTDSLLEDNEEESVAEDEAETSTELLEEEEEISSGLSSDVVTYLVMGAAVIVIVIIILITIKSIKKMDDDDEYDDEFDDEFDDDYEDDYYEDRGRDRGRRSSRSRGYEDEDEDDYDEDYEDEPAPVRRRGNESSRGSDRPAPRASERPVSRSEEPVRSAQPKQSQPKQSQPKQSQPKAADPARYMSNNPDDYRIDVDMSVFDDEPATKNSQKEADLEAAMKKMEELQKEIDRIKKE